MISIWLGSSQRHDLDVAWSRYRKEKKEKIIFFMLFTSFSLGLSVRKYRHRWLELPKFGIEWAATRGLGPLSWATIKPAMSDRMSPSVTLYRLTGARSSQHDQRGLVMYNRPIPRKRVNRMTYYSLEIYEREKEARTNRQRGEEGCFSFFG